jgi:hypothetical protein
VRQRLVKQLIGFISALDALIPRVAGPPPDAGKGVKKVISEFTGLCETVAVELSYLAALGSEPVRFALCR